MTLRLLVRPEAEADLLSARDWYDTQRAGLGDRFVEAAEELFEQIRLAPELYAQTLKNVRRAKVRRFPYVVYYRVLPEHIEVLAVLHGRQNPRTWKQRI